MNSILRLLEEWNAYQDYLWFLASLAWGGVVAAEVRRGENGRLNVQRAWLAVLALGNGLGALTELTLLAQRLVTPYTKLDAMMGAAQALGAAALAWQAAAGVRRAGIWRFVALVALGLFAGLRVPAPVAGGLGLALAQAIAVLAITRRHPAALSRTTALLLLVAPIVATHGPWANALDHGRKVTDWSHFALTAAVISLATGVILAAAAWQRRLRENAPHSARGEDLDRDLRRAAAWLVAWLAAGILLAVWYGRVARRAFEENLLRRVETCVLALNPATLAATLVPELRITELEERRFPNGKPAIVATIPFSQTPAFGDLRAQLVRLREQNLDFSQLYLVVPLQGQMVVFSSTPRETPPREHLVHRAVDARDQAFIAAERSHLEGPIYDPQKASKLFVRATVRHPVSGRFEGWLTVEVESAAWMASFVQARMQTMSLVAAGVALWVIAIAYRLRREAREAAERRATEAAAADRMKSAFLAKVSHELRTPIQSVLGYGELLQSAPLAEPHRSFLNAIRSHGGVMLRLVNDLIDLGALQSGAFRLEPGPVDLSAIVNECSAALRPAAAEKGLAFHVRIAPEVPAWVHADGVRLRQILLNLLTNAVKFTRRGAVRCEVRREDDTTIAFVIADTGPGIPPERRARLFQPFARLDPAAGGGSGLGLALVDGLCGAMGGSVRLDPDSTAGATFITRLPLVACEPAPVSSAIEPSPVTLARLRILVVDDNPLVRELLLAFLRENGALTLSATTGREALALARAQRPDVLLLDIALPDIDGIQVAAELRRTGESNLRIVGLSAHASAEDETRARAAGMDAFLIKPVSLSDLAHAITASSSPPPAPKSLRLNETLQATLNAQFTAETPGILDDMRAAIVQADWERLRQRAHYLKNSADVLGLPHLQAACRRMCELEDAAAAPLASHLLEEIVSAIPPSFFVLADAPSADPR